MITSLNKFMEHDKINPGIFADKPSICINSTPKNLTYKNCNNHYYCTVCRRESLSPIGFIFMSLQSNLIKAFCSDKNCFSELNYNS